jgi:hypothetical protein
VELPQGARRHGLPPTEKIMAKVLLLVLSLYNGVKIEEPEIEKKIIDQPAIKSTK